MKLEQKEARVYATEQADTWTVILHPNGGEARTFTVRVPARSDARKLALDEAWKLQEEEWTRGLGRLGLAFGNAKANALPLGRGKWQVFFMLSTGPEDHTVAAPSPEEAIKAGWEIVRKKRREAERMRRRF